MAIVVKINGIDRTNFIEWKHFQITHALTKETDYINFTLRKFQGREYIPNVEEEIEVWDGTTKIFGGVITEIKRVTEGLLENIEVIGQDYAKLLDRKLVIEEYKDDYAGNIVKAIVRKYAPGFTTNNVNLGSKIKSIKFNYTPVSKCIQELADQIGADWYVDYNKDIHFFFSEERRAPFDIDDTSGNYVKDSLMIAINSSQIKNAVYVRGGDVERLITPTSPEAEVYVADGVSKYFRVAHNFQPDVNFTVWISTDGGNTWTDLIECKYGDENPFCEVYYDPNNHFIYFPEPPDAGTRIKIAGKYTLPILAYVKDMESIKKYGIFEHREVDKSITSYEQAWQKAISILNDYKEPVKEVNFITYRDGLRVGQKIRIRSESRGFDFMAKITKIVISIRNPETGEKEYNVTCMGSEQVTIVDVFTRLLQQNIDKNLEIGEGELLYKLNYLSDVIVYPSFEEITKTVGGVGPFYVWDTNEPKGRVGYAIAS